MTPHKRPTNRPARRNLERIPRRKPPAHDGGRVAILVVIAIVALTTLAATGLPQPGKSAVASKPAAPTETPASSGKPPAESSATEQAPAEDLTTGPSATRQRVASHVTFGAHTQANQACETCHTNDKPVSAATCQACHGSKCGKDSKIASDCLTCHKSGTTEDWDAR